MPMIRVEADPALDTAGDDIAIVLTIEGTLDGDAGVALLQAAKSAAQDGAPRIDIDLRSITDFTDEGARSLLRCREQCGVLLDGLHYRTGQGPGREALLMAYAEEPAG
jgi:hypothetical protein